MEEAVRNALLSRGYFPKELPRTFTTETFGKASGVLLDAWRAAKLLKVQPKKYKKKVQAGSYSYELKKAELEVISAPKRGYERRNVHITHPLPQAFLSDEIARNYPSIQKWLARQLYSLDRVKVSHSNPRALEPISFALHRAKKSLIESTSDWLVKTDITRFYPSIYTHSLAWAAYGKDKVKGDLKQYEGTLADRLDVLVRSCNQNQTIGLPVGPETSRILAEIISSRIDMDFSQSAADLSPGQVDRLQDDWFIGVKSLAEAEGALATIVRIYRSYGLDINGSKSSLSCVISHTEEAWLSEIGAFISHRPGALQGGRLREFLTLTLRLQVQYERQSVVNYALTVLENQRFRTSDAEIVESFILKAAIMSSGSMSRLCEMLINLNTDTARVSKTRVKSRFTDLAISNLENGNLYEALWLLHSLRGLKISFHSKKVCELAAETPSSALALLLLDIRQRGQLASSLPIERWENAIDEGVVQTSWMWLLAYEGCRRGWLRDRKGVLNESLFAPMIQNNVAFSICLRPPGFTCPSASSASARSTLIWLHFDFGRRGV
jgi:hypothetical protein